LRHSGLHGVAGAARRIDRDVRGDRLGVGRREAELGEDGGRSALNAAAVG
jgi:hypothetical protein